MEFSMTASGDASLFWPRHVCGMRQTCVTYLKSFIERRSTWPPERKKPFIVFSCTNDYFL